MRDGKVCAHARTHIYERERERMNEMENIQMKFMYTGTTASIFINSLPQSSCFFLISLFKISYAHKFAYQKEKERDDISKLNYFVLDTHTQLFIFKNSWVSNTYISELIKVLARTKQFLNTNLSVINQKKKKKSKNKLFSLLLKVFHIFFPQATIKLSTFRLQDKKKKKKKPTTQK